MCFVYSPRDQRHQILQDLELLTSCCEVPDVGAGNQTDIAVYAVCRQESRGCLLLYIAISIGWTIERANFMVLYQQTLAN